VRVLAGRRKRQIVTAGAVVVCVALFVLEWSQAPRVEASPHVVRALDSVRGELFLGETFEGLPLRTVSPFLYSDCIPGKPKVAPVPCAWVKVEAGRVTGGDPRQVDRARKRLRRVA
jgi:hypothetical protein